MEAEAASFETSEMIATFLASTPLLSESWRLCSQANTTAPGSFVVDHVGDTSYVAFSGVQTVAGSDPSFRGLVPLNSASNGLFPLLHRHNEGEEPAMVHAGFLHLFLTMYSCQTFQNQMLAIIEKSKSVVITGHSIGGTTASLSALWLLCYLQSTSSCLSVLCITFGSPLLGNECLSRAILRERWGGNFCHIVSKHDIVPRLLLAPILSLTPQLNLLLKFWHLSMTSPQFGNLPIPLPEEEKTNFFFFVLTYVKASAEAEGSAVSPFWPFGNYLFCSEEGSICVDNAMAVLKMLHLMLMMGSASSSIEDHLRYGDYVGKVSLQFLKRRSFMQGELPESSYEAGIAFALQSSGIGSQESVATTARDCLNMVRRMGRTRPPNLNCANLAIGLSKINPYRAEIEWYKASCDQSDDQMGYYDSFKRRGALKREFKVNMNRYKLARFWDNVISMLENNQLPHDFEKRAKWVNGSHSYKLLVEPLDIAEYYRTGMHHTKGHYMKYGRERRYEIFDRWWRERKVNDEENKERSKFASLTQDSCFWARVEEAREWLDNARSESDRMKLAELWVNLDMFEKYASSLIESKEVSIDVVAKNSSYSLWMEEWREFKSNVLRFTQFPA
ncbi:hypothetical protein L1049_020367 [Liquidambar formosana]|uniref:Lipase-like PAD4 n=1 Tax=Liquidambar formosana TaxID=63359 RepID=A0AAP0SD04_LIQFO